MEGTWDDILDTDSVVDRLPGLILWPEVAESVVLVLNGGGNE